jgi:hypothetical protein
MMIGSILSLPRHLTKANLYLYLPGGGGGVRSCSNKGAMSVDFYTFSTTRNVRVYVLYYKKKG